MSMKETIQEQIKNPSQRKDKHVRLSMIWNTTQQIKRIQAELTEGYSFDKEKMEDLVKAMFEFINGIVGPDTSNDKASEVNVEEIRRD